MNDLISVIVPVYNAGQDLHRCIDSILSQSYGNLQVIAVNDGSTDSSGAILDEYSRKDSRLIAVHIENGGVSNARNTALKYASGDFISFVDSDDYIHEKLYETLLRAIRNTGCDIAEVSYTELFDNGKSVDCSKDYEVFGKENEGIIRAFLEDKLTYTVWSKLFRAEICRGVFFKQGMKQSEDALYAYNVLKKAKSVVVIPDCLYIYRNRAGSASHIGLNKKLAEDDLYFCGVLHEELSRNDKLRVPLALLEFGTYMDYYKLCIASGEQKELETRMRDALSELTADREIFLAVRDEFGASAVMIKYAPSLFRGLYYCYSSLPRGK